MPVSFTVNQYPIVDLLTWHSSGSLDLSPKFQRNPVWKLAARGQLIDTLLKGYPVPPIHIRLAVTRSHQSERQVVDGQQRMRAIIDFIEGKFRISRTIASPWAGLGFDDLDDEDRARLLITKIYTYQYESLNDTEVLEIFSRLNKYSVALNPQELRNGKYFGQFINTATLLSREALEFWRAQRIFTEQSIARMQDIQLVSELLAMQLDGLQDKKTSLDGFYAALDEDWGADAPPGASRISKYTSRDVASTEFRETLSAISAAIGDELESTTFRRVALFHTLFTVVYHRQFGVVNLGLESPQRPLDERATLRLREAVSELSEVWERKDEEDFLTREELRFVRASSQQTDNIGPRRERAEVLWNRAELGG
jgi:hypothetical protein